MGRNTTLVLVMGALVGCARGEPGVGLTSGAFTSTAIGSGGETGTEAGASTGTDDGDEVPVDPEDPDPEDPAGSSSSSGDDDASTGMAVGDEGSTGAPSDTDGEPAPEVGAWEDCAEANCADGIACVGLDGVPDAFYCAPDCIDHGDCIEPAGSDAIALCAIVTDGGAPSHCALLCSLDGEPQGDCPDHMVCTPMPGASPAFSLCLP
jgi:hypothetical protein